VKGKNKDVFECIREKKRISDKNLEICVKNPLLNGILSNLTPNVPKIVRIFVTDLN
jgi:hypothetical protein